VVPDEVQAAIAILFVHVVVRRGDVLQLT